MILLTFLPKINNKIPQTIIFTKKRPSIITVFTILEIVFHFSSGIDITLNSKIQNLSCNLGFSSISN